MTASAEPLLVVNGLTKRFGGLIAVEDLGFELYRGEILGLIGPNGAGKSTTFNLIAGSIEPTEGEIVFDGAPISGLAPHVIAERGIMRTFQHNMPFESLTVEENIRAVLELVESNREKRENILDGLLEEFAITHLRRTTAVALSGGERRRVEIARALAARPSFMLLDEPFAGIDPIAIGDIRAMVRHLTDRGIGVLITDHNVRETLELIDRALIIHEGRVLMEGKPDEIVGNKDVRRLYLGDSFSL